MNPLDRVRTISLFEGLSKSQLETLARIAVHRSYKKGHAIFSEGDEGTGFYGIISGRVKIFKLSPDGKEQILHVMEEGEIFGEVPVFMGREYPAYAEAHVSCSLLFFPRISFMELIKKDPSLSLNMLALLSLRLRRFAAYLLYQSKRAANKDQFRLDISKGQLASILGTIPETLSRILGKMGKQGLVKSEGALITILDRATLEMIAVKGKKLENI